MVRNDHKPLQKFLNRNNTNNKVNYWLLEIATYNTAFEWISDACNKEADCLSILVEIPENDTTDSSVFINAVTATAADGTTIHTHSKTKAPTMMPPGKTNVNPHNHLWRIIGTL